MNKIIDNVALAVFMEKKGRNGLSFWMQRRLEEGSAINGCWEFPGGKIEEGETPASAAQREVWEEVGIALPKVEFFGIYQWNAPKKIYRLYVHLGRAEKVPLSSEQKWFDMELDKKSSHLEGLIPPVNHQIIDDLIIRELGT